MPYKIITKIDEDIIYLFLNSKQNSTSFISKELNVKEAKVNYVINRFLKNLNNEKKTTSNINNIGK